MRIVFAALTVFSSLALATPLQDLESFHTRLQEVRTLSTNCDIDSTYTALRDGVNGLVGYTIKGFTEQTKVYLSNTTSNDNYAGFSKSTSLFGGEETYKFWIPKATGGLPLGNKAHELFTFTLDKKTGKAVALDVREREWLAILSSPLLSCHVK